MKNSNKNNIVYIIIVALFIIFAGVATCSAQSFERKGKVFEQVTTKTSNTGTKTEFTWKDTKGNEYPIYITKTGRCYVMKVSGKTGKEYKYYLKEDISREVAKEMNITYVEPKKKN